MKTVIAALVACVVAGGVYGEVYIPWTTANYKISNHLNNGGTIATGSIAQMIYSKNSTADSGLISGSFASMDAAKSWVADSNDEIILATYTFTDTFKNIGWDASNGSDALFASNNANVTVDTANDRIVGWSGSTTPGITASSIVYIRVIEIIGSTGYSAYGGIQIPKESFGIAPPLITVTPIVTSTTADGQGNSNGWVTTATGVRGPGATSGKGWSQFGVVPEPATVGLLGLAMAAMGWKRRRMA